MATVIDRPSSIPSDASTLHRNMSTNSVEIIDVDQFDDPPVASSSTTRTAFRQPLRRQTETISLLDSDDDDVIMLPGTQTRVRPRLFSPPPPVPSASSSHLPPVPPLPRGLIPFSSLPSRRQTPSVTSPPVVRPNAQPFAFEMATGNAGSQAGPSRMHLHPNRHRRVPQNDPLLQPAAPSHHTPSMGFGGALLAFNSRARAQARARAEEQRLADEGGGRWFSRANDAVQRVVQLFTRSRQGDMEAEDHLEHLFSGFDDFEHPMRRFAQQEMAIRHRHIPPADYKPEYTHPTPPESGFTFNFAPPEPPSDGKGKGKEQPTIIDLVNDEDSPMAGPSSQSGAPPSPPAKVSTLLACCHCLDALVLGSGLVGDDAKNRRVWALRCGHMIDGKCLEQIAVPEAEKTSAEDEGGMDANVDRKGKGKAKEVPEPERHGEEENNNIRSRLRSRGSTSMMSVDSVEPTPAPPPSNLGKRKRNSTTAKNKVQQTHEWLCPVQGCGRMHVSVKINDVWEQEGPSGPTITRKGKERKLVVKPDAPGGRLGRGAIACFV